MEPGLLSNTCCLLAPSDLTGSKENARVDNHSLLPWKRDLPSDW